jgi:beta-lactamase superfamily II metal-dependent hydrolase
LLAVHILNVGHGDSIVLEYEGEQGRVFGVIDSNNKSGQVPPALRKLRELGAQKLSFVALTHPHADHYKGLLDILEEYRGQIDNFYSFPLDHDVEGRIKELSEIYLRLLEKTDGKTPRSALTEYIKILSEVTENIGLENWQEHTGLENAIAPNGFIGVDMHAIMPLPVVKGKYFQLIQGKSYDAVENPDLNELSLAYQINYKGCQLVLGGDVPHHKWLQHKRQNARRGSTPDAVVVKLSHHGAEKDCKKEILEYVFSPNGERYACISANGRSHPHVNTLLELKEQNVMPYCTNLAVDCGAEARKVMLHDSSIKPDLVLYLNRVMEEIPGQRSQPCQGDITIIIDDDGVVSIDSEYDFPCPYRGGYDFLG